MGEGKPGSLVRRGLVEVEEMEEREKVVCLAKLAEQAERYDGKGSHPPGSALLDALSAVPSFLVPCILGKSVLCSLSERNWASLDFDPARLHQSWVTGFKV